MTGLDYCSTWHGWYAVLEGEGEEGEEEVG